MADLQNDYSGMDTDEKDFPASTATPGVVESGWLDYGRVSQSGDIDWFKVGLTAGVKYGFQVEAGSINGLFDPQLSVYSASNELLATATIGQGFQSKWVELTPTTSGNYYLSASGDSGVFGDYKLYVLTGDTAALTPATSPPIVASSTSGNDIFLSSSVNELIDGGQGIDVVRYSGSYNDYTVTASDSGFTVQDHTSSRDGSDTLLNIERLKFDDVSLALDISGIGGQAYRVYKAAFARAPDSSGVGYWISKMDAEMSLQEVSARFIDSDEFRTLYGSNPTNAEFLTKVYTNVLGRAPDTAGYNWWLNEINTNPEKTKSKILADFSESTENQESVITLIGNGFSYTEWVG